MERQGVTRPARDLLVNGPKRWPHFAARVLLALGRTGGKSNEITETRYALLIERLGPERFLKAARTGRCKILSIGSWM